MPKTDFRPQTDGFAFKNEWDFSQDNVNTGAQIRQAFLDAHQGLQGALEGIFGAAFVAISAVDHTRQAITGGDPLGYGLCGGMAYSSLDYWQRRWVVPRGRGSGDQPQWNSPTGHVLRDYIRSRLADTLAGGGVAAKTLLWMAIHQYVPEGFPFNGGAPWLTKASHDEFRKLKAKIDAGQPWPIGLIGTTQVPFYQHQVLAYGYEDPGDGTGRLYVCDSNCPGEECIIDVDFRGKVLDPQGSMERCHGDLRGDLRGFFCSDYAPATPPIAVGVTAAPAATGQPRVGQQVGFTFTARNTGYRDTPPLALYVAGRAGANRDVNVDPGGEPGLTAIAEGAERAVSVSAVMRGPEGAQVFSASCYLGPDAGVNCWKVLPLLGSGGAAETTLQVHAPHLSARVTSPALPLPQSAAVTFQVHAADADTGQAVAAEVWIDGVHIGATGAPLVHGFTPTVKTERVHVIDPKTHLGAWKVTKSYTYPKGEVRAAGYASAPLDFGLKDSTETDDA